MDCNKMLLAFVYLVLTIQTALGVGTGRYRCNADRSFAFTYTWDDPDLANNDFDPFNRLLLQGSSACVAVRSNNDLTTTLTITDLSAQSHACAGGFTYNAGTNEASGIVIYVTKASSIVQQDDLVFDAITCDFNTPTVQQIVTPSPITASGIPTVTATATEALETVVMHMVDATSATSITAAKDTCNLGDNLKFRLTLTPSATADGVHAVACRARNQAEAVGAISLNLVTESCSLPGVVSMTGTQGFKKDVTTDFGDVSKNYYVFEDTLKCFSFHPSDQVHFECDVTFCGTTSIHCDGNDDGDSCTHKDVAPGGSARKRREVTNSTDTTQKKASVTILVGNYPTSASSKSNEDYCSGFLHQTTFIVIVTILAVLLALSMTATVWVARKSRSADANAPPYLAKGVDNPAF